MREHVLLIAKCESDLIHVILAQGSAYGSKNEEYKAELRKYFPMLKRWK